MGDDAHAALVRAELDRILASEVFKRSGRLSSFLKFIVERTLAGDGDSLKEHVIAIELYGKATDFEAAVDPIVRVDARRLRDKLREYYAGAPQNGVLIAVPKGSYTPVFQQRNDANRDADAVIAPTLADAHTRRSATYRWWWIGTAGITAIAVAYGGTRLGIHERSEPLRLLTATAMPGAEENPSLSPDGNFVAFSWGGAEPDVNHDIWVKAVEGEALQNLTKTPTTTERYPKYSPDGQYIAFTRYEKSQPAIFKISALGGAEEMIAEGSSEAAWTSDGRSLVVVTRTPTRRSGLVHHILATGERRQLTDVPDPFLEGHPAVSPDGKTVAFLRYAGTRSAVFTVPLEGGEPQILGEWNSGTIAGVTWMPNGRELLIARPHTSGRRVVREPLDGGAPAALVPGVPHGSVNPTLSGLRGDTYRLAFTSGLQDVGMRMVDLHAPQKEGTIVAHAAFCDATRMDAPGRFSRNGNMVAFASDRSGSQEVWVANRDGSALRSVTQLREATVSLGSWSPDGRSLVFDATIGGETHIYVAAVTGGPAQRLTKSPSVEIDAEWSRDGRWIYYASNQSGRSSIWKVPAEGGTGTQLTSELGFEPRESPDGKSIYFIDRPRRYGLGIGATLKRLSVAGGPVETVDVPVMPGAWDIADNGIVFISVPRLSGPMGFNQGPDVLQLYDFSNGRIHTLGTFGFRVGPFASNHFLKVSPDGRWAVVSHVDRWDRDILVIDKFR